MTRDRRDRAIKALYDASAALQIAKESVTDPILIGRIRELAHDVMNLIGKTARQPVPAEPS
jgi:hypothetical protein